MKQKILILFVFVTVTAVLVGLNFASYSQRPKEADTEFVPNRSTYNSGSTGTLGYFSLLAETGIKAVRWQEPPAALLTQTKNAPTFFVVVGQLRRQFEAQEINDLLDWVSSGGYLVMIDRAPPPAIVSCGCKWELEVTKIGFDNVLSIDPADLNTMTEDVAAGKSIQPTLLTAGVNGVQHSVFASGFSVRLAKDEKSYGSAPTATPPPVDTETFEDAPVIHVASDAKNLVVDSPYGAGRIIFVSDPFIVSNAGISLADNAQLAVNLVRSETGIVAFDEYHQGHGANTNRFFEFFAGTPVVAIFFQILVVAGLLFYSQSRRFARPVDGPEPDRLSKLEYVSAMAALQQRSRAYDLAVENIYRDFKRRASRLLGFDLSKVSTSDLATRIAERISTPRAEIEATLDECEQIIYGQATSKRRVVELIAAIRKMEIELGLRRRSAKK